MRNFPKLESIIAITNQSWWDIYIGSAKQKELNIDMEYWSLFIIKTIVSVEMCKIYRELVELIKNNQPSTKYLVLSSGISGYDKSRWINRQEDLNHRLICQSASICRFFKEHSHNQGEKEIDGLQRSLGADDAWRTATQPIEWDIYPPCPEKDLKDGEAYFHFFISQYVIASQHKLLGMNERKIKSFVQTLIENLDESVERALQNPKDFIFSQDIAMIVQMIRSKISSLEEYFPRDFTLKFIKPIFNDVFITEFPRLATEVYILLLMKTLCQKIEYASSNGIFFNSSISFLEKKRLEPWIFNTKKMAILWWHDLRQKINTNNRQLLDLFNQINKDGWLKGWEGQTGSCEYHLYKPCKSPSFINSFYFFLYNLSYLQGFSLEPSFIERNPSVRIIHAEMKKSLNALKQRLDSAPDFDEVIIERILYEEATKIMQNLKSF